MKYKCVFRDVVGTTRVLELEADSLEQSLVGLHDKCRETVKAVDEVDKSKMMVWLEFIFDEDMNHYKIMYPNRDGNTDIRALEAMTGERVVIMGEPVFPETKDMEA